MTYRPPEKFCGILQTERDFDRIEFMEKQHGRVSPQTLRRFQGGELLQNGYDIDEVAEITGVSIDSVKRWAKKLECGGLETLARKAQSGRPATLKPEQLKQLYDIIVAGAVAAGFENERWTSKRIVGVIAKTFGVTYHKNDVWEVLRKIGLSPQRATTRSKKRSQDAIAHGLRYDWTRIKKKRSPTIGR